MTKLIGAILSLSILFGTGAAPASAAEVTANVPVMVGAQQAVYEKYECIAKNEQYYYISSSSQVDRYVAPNGIKGSTSYSLDEITGIFKNAGANVTIGGKCLSAPCSGSCYPGGYSIEGGMLYRYSAYGGTDNSTDRCVYTKDRYNLSKANRTVYSKGTPKGTVTAVTDSLPSDGRHTDGYWYVFKNLVQD